ncbi:uncharacterized protein LOC131208447 [Anopheles bellator]|uniref:uncharacterized protein LOC131208447 n=1 Tax=Anopheles bellator TaxID=139047 RepID=UPI002648057F|nr:uncharacterized protein LOC131208447 [Anopheles bellator]
MSDPGEKSSNSVCIWPGLVATSSNTNPASKNPVNNTVLNQRKRLTITLNAHQLQKCVPVGKPVVILPNTSNSTLSEQQNVTVPSFFFSPTVTSTLPSKYQLMFTKQPTIPSSGQSPAQCNTVSAPVCIHLSKDLLRKDISHPATSLIQTSTQSSASSIPMVSGIKQIVNPLDVSLTPKTDLTTGKQVQLQLLRSARTKTNTITSPAASSTDSSQILISENTPMAPNDGNKTRAPEKQKQMTETVPSTSALVQQKQTKLLYNQILRQENIISVPTKNPDSAGSKKEKHFIVTDPPTSGTQKRRRLVVITKELGKAKGKYSQILEWARKVVKPGNRILTPIMAKSKGKQVKLGLSSSSITPATSTSDVQSSTDGRQVQRRLVVVTKDAENVERRLLVFTKNPEKAKVTGSIKCSITQPKGNILKQGHPPKVPKTLNPIQGRTLKQKQGNLSNSSNNQTQRWAKTLSSSTKNPHGGETNKEKQQLKVILPHSSPKSIDSEKLDMQKKLRKLHCMVKDFSNEVNSLNKRFQNQLWPLEADRQREQMADLPTKKRKIAKEQDTASEISTMYEDPPMDWSDEDPPMEDEIKWELDEHELPTLLKEKLESSANNRHQQEQDPLTLETEPENQQNVTLQRDLLEVKTEQDDHQNVPLQEGPLAGNTRPIIGSHQDDPLPQDPFQSKVWFWSQDPKPEQLVDNCRSVSSQLDPLSIKTYRITEDGTFLSPCNVLRDSQLLSFGNLLDTPSEHDPLTIEDQTNPLADTAQHLLEIKTEPGV